MVGTRGAYGGIEHNRDNAKQCRDNAKWHELPAIHAPNMRVSACPRCVPLNEKTAKHFCLAVSFYGADGGNRTPNLLITNQLHYRCATSANYLAAHSNL